LVIRAPVLWLLLVCAVVYGRALLGDFVLDDWPVVKENSRITELHYIRDYFTSGVWSNTDLGEKHASFGNFLYRPLFMLVLNLGYQSWATNAVAYHALNIALHGINTILLFYIILGLSSGRETVPAFFGALLFAVHPVHVESIAWIAGLTDPLVSIFLLSNFLLYRHYLLSGRILYAGLALVCYGAGLMSKEVAVFFPAVLIIHDWILSRSSLRRIFPYLVLLVVYFIARAIALGDGIALERFHFSNLPTLIEYFLRYIQLLVFPWPLEFYVGGPSSNLPAIGIGALVMLAGLFVAAGAYRNRDPLPLLGAAWFVITLLPALPIALLEDPVFAIRVLYLPSAGLALVVAWLYPRMRGKVLTIRTAWGVLLVFAVFSIVEISDWKDEVTFHLRAIESNPESAVPYEGLARAYERNGNLNKAAESYLRAAALAREENRRLIYLEDAAVLFGQQGDITNSEHSYREILDRDPQHSSAWVGMGNNAWARNDMQRAIEFYLKAYDANPNNYVASYNLSIAYQKLGNYEQAQYFENIARRLKSSSTPPE
jgi:tetratricopeptide (TPR) repeat protein